MEDVTWSCCIENHFVLNTHRSVLLNMSFCKLLKFEIFWLHIMYSKPVCYVVNLACKKPK